MTHTDPKWTPEPWYRANDRCHSMFGVGADRDGSPCIILTGNHNFPDAEANEDRAFACVNALAGIPDPEAWVREVEELPWRVIMTDGSGDVLARFRYHGQASEWVRRNYEGRCAVLRDTDSAGGVGP